MSLKNETAIITGSTSGIGKKIAELFLEEGCKVVVCSRNEENVQQTVKEFNHKFRNKVIGVPCDVSNAESVKNLIDKAISAFGSIRILVANAGINVKYGPLHFQSIDEIDDIAKKVLGTNLRGVITTITGVLPHMITQGYGRIVTLSGGGADRPIENMTVYSASKGGVVAFSKCLAEEFKHLEEDIKINIFQPGMIDTNLNKNTQLIEDWKDKETYDRDLEIIYKNVATDIDESCRNVLPYVLQKTKSNGKIFRGFSIFKLIKGFRKVSKERKKLEKTQTN